jgi:endoplasmic reticulum-Golgi intermediate compartment protein 3
VAGSGVLCFAFGAQSYCCCNGLSQSGGVNPLEGHGKVLPKETTNGMFQYFIKVVPTDFKTGDNTMSTFQYSVTEYFRPVSVARGGGLPGVFFFYDLSSIRVTVEPNGMSLGHLLTNLCAIAGGLVTVMGAVDKAVHFLMKYAKAKKYLA